MTSTTARLISTSSAVLLCSALVLSACGGGGDSGPAPTLVVPVVATVLSGAGAGDLDGPRDTARFRQLTSISFSEGALYVADYGNAKIRKVSLDGTSTTLLDFFKNAPPPLSRPFTVTASGGAEQGLFFFRITPDPANHRPIYYQRPDGRFTEVPVTTQGQGSSALAYVSGIGNAGARLYYADNDQIKVDDLVNGSVVRATKTVSSLSADAQGTVYYATTDSVGTIDSVGKDTIRKAGLNFAFPPSTAFDDAGNVYVASGSLISKVSVDGSMTTVIDLARTLNDVAPNSAVVRSMVWSSGALYVASESRILRVAPVN